MFDIGASELLLIVVVAVLVIGPKDLPLAMRTAGRWIAKVRKLSGHFRTGIDAMVREAELHEMEEKWKAQNAAIMREHPEGAPAEGEPTGAYPPGASQSLGHPPDREAELKRLARQRDEANAALAEAEKAAVIEAKQRAIAAKQAEAAAESAAVAPEPGQ